MDHHADEWVLLASIVRPQGRRGEVLADLHTDFPERFAERQKLYLRLGASEPRPAELESFWLPTGKSAGRVVLKFATTNSITEAESLTGAEVLLPETERVPLGENEFYVSDLTGCLIFDGEHAVGTVTGVHFPSTPAGRRIESAAPILIVTRENGDEVMIPLATEFLAEVDLSAKRIQMRLPQGLVEMNG